MDKLSALEIINSAWKNDEIPLGERINIISDQFYSSGLDLASTAAFIKATPTELETLLSLGRLDDEMIEQISAINPPETAWAMFASASDEEIVKSIDALKEDGIKLYNKASDETLSEYLYSKMITAFGPTTYQILGALSGNEIKTIQKKAEDYSAVNDWENKFLKSIYARKKRGKTLTDKQINKFKIILESLVEQKVIVRDSIDGDKDLCNLIIDALEK